MVIDLLKDLNDRYLSLEDLSRYSGIGKTSLRQHIVKDQLPAFCPGGKIFVRRSDFDKWIQQYRYHAESRKRNQKELSQLADEIVNEIKDVKTV